jgi:hypothetical protein
MPHFFQSVKYVILNGIGPFQPFPVHSLLVQTEMQSILTGEVFAYPDGTVTVIPVGYRLAIVVYAVEHDVDMRMLAVMMADYQQLGV